jgi:hypothetical protein
MPVEIKEMVINTSVESTEKLSDDAGHNIDLVSLKTKIIKECLDKLKDYLDRQIQR